MFALVHFIKKVPKKLLFETLSLMIWVLKFISVQALFLIFKKQSIAMVDTENKHIKMTHIKMYKYRKEDILIPHDQMFQLLKECYLTFEYYK